MNTEPLLRWPCCEHCQHDNSGPHRDPCTDGCDNPPILADDEDDTA